MVLSNEDLLRIRDDAVDRYRDCLMHIANAEVTLEKMLNQRQKVIINFNDNMYSITEQIDKVKNGKTKLFACQIELEYEIKELNQLISERRL